ALERLTPGLELRLLDRQLVVGLMQVVDQKAEGGVVLALEAALDLGLAADLDRAHEGDHGSDHGHHHGAAGAAPTRAGDRAPPGWSRTRAAPGWASRSSRPGAGIGAAAGAGRPGWRDLPAAAPSRSGCRWRRSKTETAGADPGR